MATTVTCSTTSSNNTRYNEYVLGESIRIWARFRVDKALTDPTDVIITLKDPDGNRVAYTYSDDDVIRLSVGKYYLIIRATKIGQWYYYIEGTDTAAGVEEDGFTVIASNVMTEEDFA